MNSFYEELQNGNNIRENLIQLKKQWQDKNAMEEFQQEYQDAVSEFLRLLSHQDAKIRKNSALLIGMLKDQSSLQQLWSVYKEEQTRFVKSAYLKSMAQLDCMELKEEIQLHYKQLMEYQPAQDELKHIQEERQQLLGILSKLGALKKHKFIGYERKNQLLFTAGHGVRETLAAELKNYTEDEDQQQLHPLGVMVDTCHMEKIMQARCYREMLFLLKGNHHLPQDPSIIAGELAASNLLQILEECHQGEAPFYFRLEIRSRMNLEEKSNFAKKLAGELEQITSQKLQNSTKGYEIELRFIENKEGTFFPCLKLYTLRDHRFSYRRETIASAMHPALAAALMEMADPYLEEDAIVLDPFCGTGTLLIERQKHLSLRDCYGVDIFGEAIRCARINTASAGYEINYITRDYFEFTSRHLFDEVFADFPVRGKKTREEQDKFYTSFFDQVETMMQPHGKLFLYTNESGFVKKNLRLHPDFILKKEVEIRKKDGSCFFIIEYAKGKRP